MEQLGLIGAAPLGLSAVYLIRSQRVWRRSTATHSVRTWFWIGFTVAGAVAVGSGGLALLFPVKSLTAIILRDVGGPALAAVVLAVLGTLDRGSDAEESLRRLGGS